MGNLLGVVKNPRNNIYERKIFYPLNNIFQFYGKRGFYSKLSLDNRETFIFVLQNVSTMHELLKGFRTWKL